VSGATKVHSELLARHLQVQVSIWWRSDTVVLPGGSCLQFNNCNALRVAGYATDIWSTRVRPELPSTANWLLPVSHARVSSGHRLLLFTGITHHAPVL